MPFASVHSGIPPYRIGEWLWHNAYVRTLRLGLVPVVMACVSTWITPLAAAILVVWEHVSRCVSRGTCRARNARARLYVVRDFNCDGPGCFVAGSSRWVSVFTTFENLHLISV